MSTLPICSYNPSIDAYSSDWTRLHGTTASYINVLAFVLLGAQKSACTCKPAGCKYWLTDLVQAYAFKKWKRNALSAYDSTVNLLNVNCSIKKATFLYLIKHSTFADKPSDG